MPDRLDSCRSSRTASIDVECRATPLQRSARRADFLEIESDGEAYAQQCALRVTSREVESTTGAVARGSGEWPLSGTAGASIHFSYSVSSRRSLVGSKTGAPA